LPLKENEVGALDEKSTDSIGCKNFGITFQTMPGG
jgi:hypothetical protein